MSIYSDNLELLKNKWPELASVAENGTESLEIRLIENDLLKNNAKISYNGRNCFLASLYNVEEEMGLMFKKVKRDTEILFVFGLGNGDIFAYIRDNFTNLKRIIVIEPSVSVYKFILKTRNVLDLIKDLPSITLLINKSALEIGNFLMEIMRKNIVYSCEFVKSYYCQSVFKQYCKDAEENLVKIMRRNRVNMLTLSATRMIIMRNTLMNMQNKSILSDNLTGLLNNRPAVIISAGPSLNKHLPLLNILKKKAVLIAVGSSIKILQKNGIIPHFIAAIDWSEREKKEIFSDEAVLNSNIPLIYANQLYGGIIQKYSGEKILMLLDNDFFGRYFYDASEIKYKIVSASASVASIIFDFLCQSNCREVILLGQDMCYYEENKIYAEGREVSTKEKHEFGKQIILKDIYGGKVYSNLPLLSIKYDYEELRKRYPDIRVINATEGGLGIDGVPNMPLEKLINQLDDIKVNINDELEKISSKNFDINKQKLVLEELLKQIIKLRKLNMRRNDFIRKVNKKRKRNLKKKILLNDIKYFDELEKQLCEYDIYTKVIKKVIDPQLGVLHLKLRNEEDEVEKAIQMAANICVELDQQLQMIIAYLKYELNLDYNLEKVN